MRRRLTHLLASGVLVAGVMAVGLSAQPASATARCDHGSHTHQHGSHRDLWVFRSHAGTNPHVHLFQNVTHNVYDVANC